MLMSAIWCGAQLVEQPAKCRRKSLPWPFSDDVLVEELAISAARLSGVTLARPQNSLPVQVCRPRSKSVGGG